MILAPLPAYAPAGIYIHVPFCSHICPYCDFTTYAGKQSLIPRFAEAVVRELWDSASLLDGREIGSVFLGGGTPSLLEPEHLATMLATIRAEYKLLADAEITMEANPNGLDQARLTGYLEAGVNRLSIGAQTLDRRGLRTLGRQHESSDVMSSIIDAREAGFERLGIDLIFGWPGQTAESWRRDLTTLLELPNGPDHLSLYSLIVEPGTPYADAAARGILAIPDDDATADLYEAAIELLDQAGWRHYEIANWGNTPDNYSRHNALYWQHGDYLGIGAGAHGHIGGVRTINHLLPETYIQSVEAGDGGVANRETIDAKIARIETIMMGLRLLESGINLPTFKQRHIIRFEAEYSIQIEELTNLGMIERQGQQIRLTQCGMMVANEVISRFM